MATINFILQSKRNPAPIYVRVREGKGVDVKARTEYSIDPTQWSKAKGQPKNLKDAEYKKLNSNLESFKLKLSNRLNELEPFEIVTTQWLKNFIVPPPPTEKLPNNLIEYFDIYLDRKKTEVSKSTIKKLKVIKALVTRMQTDTKTLILIENINLNFKTQFERYCLKNNYAPNTIARALKFIKTVCTHSRIGGLKTHPQLDSIKGKPQRSTHIHLTFEELDIIENKSLSESLSNARDWLIISCYTGQRVSDFMHFDKSIIRETEKTSLIEFTQTKTKKIMSVPLHKKVLEILKKRNGEFPRAISDQRYNEYIKLVCKESELIQKVTGSRKNPETKRKETGIFEKWELVSSHIGRRSFATNFYGKIPTSLLIAATGHSTENMFLQYIGKSNADRALELAEYFNKSNDQI